MGSFVRLKNIVLIKWRSILRWPKNVKFKRRLVIQFAIVFLVFYLFYLLGIFTHMLEKDLVEFRYPLKIDIRVAIQNMDQADDQASSFDVNNLNYSFIHKAEQMCAPIKLNAAGSHKSTNEKLFSRPLLIILVKSKITNFKSREIIRKTWGMSDKFNLIRTVFLVGQMEINSETISNKRSNYDGDGELDNEKFYESKRAANIKRKAKSSQIAQSEFDMVQNDDAAAVAYHLELENEKYRDIVQQNFHDTYYNNTLKAFMGLKWIEKYCSNVKFYLFIDDDFYLNQKLLIKYLLNNVTEDMLPSFYAGYVFSNSSPMRHMFSKWYISLKDYPYHKFPPYVSAGFYLLSQQSAHLFYMASKLIRKFKLDDIYMGILAYKLDIKPLHMDNVYYYAPTYFPSVYAHEVIGSHGFSPEQIMSMWQQLEQFIKFDPPLSLLS
jgi:beta-1,3-galactosyltransferase / beta-1,3-N-acetylglucosaminyltransferase